MFQSRKIKEHLVYQWRDILLFGILFSVFAQRFALPIGVFLVRFSLSRIGIDYVRNDNIMAFIKNPWVILVLLCAFILFAALLFFQLYATIKLTFHKDPNYRLMHVFYDYPKDLRSYLQRKNIAVLPLLLLLLIFSGSIFNATVLSDLALPTYIMDTIEKTPIYFGLYLGSIFVLSVLTFYLVFVPHGMIIGKRNLGSSIRQSIQLLKGRFLITYGKILGFSLLVTLLLLSLYALLMAVIVGILYLIGRGDLSGLNLTIILSVSKGLIFTFSNLLFMFSVTYLGILYENFGGRIEKEEIRVRKLPYKKWVVPVLSVVILGFSALQVIGVYFSIDFLKNPILSSHTTITAHRGSSFEAPENTMAALRKAIEAKADFAEIDVQLTKDGRVIVFHDTNLRRVTGVTKAPVDTTYEEIRTLDAGSWFSAAFAGEKIPLVEELIQEAGNQIRLNIELKPTGNEKELAAAVYKILTAENFKDRVIVSSLNKQALYAMKELDPTIPTGYILAVALGDFYRDDKIDFYSIESTFVNQETVSKLHLHQKEVHAWTINTDEDIERMKMLGVDSIITDFPVKAREIFYSSPLEKGLLEIISNYGL